MNDLTGIEELQAIEINKMFIQHLDKHVEQELELAISRKLFGLNAGRSTAKEVEAILKLKTRR